MGQAGDMTLDHRQSNVVFAIMRDLVEIEESCELRRSVGGRLLDLFRAQHFASYVWSEREGRFTNRVFINMNADNLDRYETYYQFRDPITPTLQRRRRATGVAEIISRGRLEKSEFFNDFLAPDGLHYGMNYHAYSASKNIGDLRIWRSRQGDEYTRRDIALFDAIGPAFTQALLRCGRRSAPGADGDIDVLDRIEREGRRLALTRREKEIAKAIVEGKSDREIGDALCIGFPTVRSHLQSLYAKFGVGGRAQLARALTIGSGRDLERARPK